MALMVRYGLILTLVLSAAVCRASIDRIYSYVLGNVQFAVFGDYGFYPFDIGAEHRDHREVADSAIRSLGKRNKGCNVVVEVNVARPFPMPKATMGWGHLGARSADGNWISYATGADTGILILYNAEQASWDELWPLLRYALLYPDSIRKYQSSVYLTAKTGWYDPEENRSRDTVETDFCGTTVDRRVLARIMAGSMDEPLSYEPTGVQAVINCFEALQRVRGLVFRPYTGPRASWSGFLNDYRLHWRDMRTMLLKLVNYHIEPCTPERVRRAWLQPRTK